MLITTFAAIVPRPQPSNPEPTGATAYYTARRMGTVDHVNALDREGQLLVAAARSAGTRAPVPSCPGWEVRDLLAHVGFVHRWAARYVAEGLTEMVEEPDEASVLSAAPSHDRILSWAADGHAALVEVLSSAPRDVQCWTFLPAPSPLAFWARRQAHETAVHRVDAELAAGARPTPFNPAFAVDGSDELLLGFFARPGRGRAPETSPGTVGLEATDAGSAAWTMHISPEGIETTRGLDESDLSVRGPASDLYLLLWNRLGWEDRPHESLELVGRQDLLSSWREHFKVTWT
ncbi:MAG TPA: maleylpyruvate isomerase family mycothiol-dependent enzyme [Acidimicrobiales bacterium]|nr:maleylpyruvate isomerase family mycothiol-dependent enzyme [Acidimicrobiales bacterium]